MNKELIRRQTNERNKTSVEETNQRLKFERGNGTLPIGQLMDMNEDN